MSADVADSFSGKQPRSKLIILVALLLLAALISFFIFRPGGNDPFFKGRRLSSYVEQLPATSASGDGVYFSMPVDAPQMSGMSKAQIARYDRRTQAKAEEAREALRVLGQRSIPCLLEYVGKKESASDRLLEKVKPLLRWLHIRTSHALSPASGIILLANRTYTARWQAVTAFRELKHAECNLDPAVPQLIQLARDADPDISLAARFLLRHMHREIPLYDYGRQNNARP